jgi:hypothetical protein
MQVVHTNTSISENTVTALTRTAVLRPLLPMLAQVANLHNAAALGCRYDVAVSKCAQR